MLIKWRQTQQLTHQHLPELLVTSDLFPVTTEVTEAWGKMRQGLRYYLVIEEVVDVIEARSSTTRHHLIGSQTCQMFCNNAIWGRPLKPYMLL